MEYVEGRNLGEVLKERPVTAREAAEYTRQAAEAIQYAHDRGVLHRDLKPSNILVEASGRVRITDFGLAKSLRQDSGLTATGDVIGTPSYMSPEQADGQHDKTRTASDVYSLGAVLYELLAGRPPFKAATAVATLRQVQELEPISLRALDPSLPKDLETIVRKCLQTGWIDCGFGRL